MRPLIHWSKRLIGLLLVLLAVRQIQATTQGLTITRVPGVPPLTIVRPTGAQDRPVVLIGHGLAGSRLLMRGFTLTLAHAGYTVVAWDFDGHGANPQPLSPETDRASLITNAEFALAEARARGLVTPGQVAILGHSMGSGVALIFGQDHPETAATIAISPVDRKVTPDLPRNLLLMAGSLEAPFVRNARERLSEAGGPGGDLAAGTARQLRIISGVEHLSILFAPASHAVARDWLDATFGPQQGSRQYTDWRLAWYGVGLLGCLLIAWTLAPLTSSASRVDAPPPDHAGDRPSWQRLIALALGALGATLTLWAAGQADAPLRDLLGLLVGGYLLLWFGIAGTFSLLLLRVHPSRPSRRAAWGGALAFATLWLGVGWLGQMVWLQWLLIRQRLQLWPLGALLLLPWFLAVGEVTRRASVRGQIGGWLAHNAILIGGLWLGMRSSPDLGFIGLILPLFPAVLGLHVLAALPYRDKWPFALSGAAFVSWLLLTVFPLG
jgi:pimeloyl-ACP methyl ester carboxylesterase